MDLLFYYFECILRERVKGKGRKAIYPKVTNISGHVILHSFNCLPKSCLYIPIVLLCSQNIEEKRRVIHVINQKYVQGMKRHIHFKKDTSGCFYSPVPLEDSHVF